MPITFVYRSPYVGPLGKRVVSLRDESVLAFFQRGIRATADKDPSAWLKKELGCDVYGLESFFREIHEGGDEDADDDEDGSGFTIPGTLKELRSLLDEHLYVEGEFR